MPIGQSVLSDGLSMDEWQRRRAMQLGDSAAPAHKTSLALRDNLPTSDWHRVRTAQVLSNDMPSDAGAGEE